MIDLSILPSGWKFALRVIALLVFLGAVAGGGWAARGVVADRDVAELKEQFSREQTAAVESALTAERAARVEEKRLETVVEKPAHEDRTIEAPKRRADANSVRAAADRVRAAADRMRDARPAAAIDAAPASDTEDSKRSAAAADASGVQAELLAECSGRVADLGARLAALAIFADAAHGAGRTCERGWEAMTADPPAAASALERTGHADE